MCKSDRKPLFFSDLDGTLIFSAQKKQAGDIVCEFKDGAEISCITPLQEKLLPLMSFIIPVTTRSVEQYKRIQFPKGFSSKYALTDNGGILLINGEIDPEWRDNSLKLAEKCERELSICRKALERDIHRSFEIRTVDGLFLFTKSNNPQKTLEMLKKASKGRLECFSTGAKIYAVPPEICKGKAALRLAEKLSHNEKIVAAGDSLMDLPLLNSADFAICPDDLRELVTAERTLFAPRERFTELVTREFYRLYSEDRT